MTSNTTLRGKWISLFIRMLDFYCNIPRNSAGTIVRSTYGHEIESNEDGYIKLASDAIVAANSIAVPGLNLIDIAPICKPTVDT